MSDVVRFSEAANLALHAAALLAGNHEVPLSNRMMAHSLGASEAHLSKVMRSLVLAGLVRSFRGPQGGFRLARPRETVSMLEVFEAVEGALESRSCLLLTPLCGGVECIFGSMLPEVTDRIMDYLSETMLSDIEHVTRGMIQVGDVTRYCEVLREEGQ